MIWNKNKYVTVFLEKCEINKVYLIIPSFEVPE